MGLNEEALDSNGDKDTNQQSVEETDNSDDVDEVGSDGGKTFSSKELRECSEWMKELKKKEVDEGILMDVGKKKFKKRKKSLLMDLDSDESGDESSEDTEVEQKRKHKWKKGLKDVDDLFKDFITPSRGANVLKELMSRKIIRLTSRTFIRIGILILG